LVRILGFVSVRIVMLVMMMRAVTISCDTHHTHTLTDEPGKSGRPFTISAKMHPTLHMSTEVE
jgi:hypothetical protein